MAEVTIDPSKLDNNLDNSDKPRDQDMNLHDDRADQSSEFKGATLSLDENNKNTEAEVTFQGPEFERNRPLTASRKSTASSGSQTSRSRSVLQNPTSVKTYFSYRNDAFENAVEKCQEVTKADLDGQLIGAWLLTEIDHWDNEREKIVMLLTNSIMLVKYDFIALKVLEAKRVMLHMIDIVQIGDFIYPEKSLMIPRDYGGMRISWGKGVEPSFGQKWNPWCSDIPYLTFCHHPLIYHEKEKDTVTFSVDDFYESLRQGINAAYRKLAPGQTLQIQEGPILIESYGSLSSMIFNQSHLGFNRERGGVSY